MPHVLSGVAKAQRLVQPPARLCHLRVSSIRLEQIEPSSSDVPVTRARYSAFAPPTRVAVEGTSRAQSPGRPGVSNSPQLHVAEGPLQSATPLTDKQLEEFSTSVLSSSSSVWSAEERNLPASTSDSHESADKVLEHVKGKGPSAILRTLKALSKRGEFDVAIRVLQECSKPTLETVCKRWHYSDFLEAVGLSMKAKPAIQFAKLAVPYVGKPVSLLEAVLQTCAKCRDLDAGMTAIELARKHGLSVDVQLLTTLIKVCKSVGNVDKAYRVYLDMRAARLPLDSYVYGSLIATCAEAMKRDLTVVHERKDQYVLLERAFHYVEEAEAAGVALQAPVWNALMVCAGRSGELNRAFEVLTMMQQRGIVANAATYGSLIESCVCARQPEKALRVFEVALAKGFVSEVKLYTQALSACMLRLPGAWERALRIYASMQRAAVRPDKKFFACLMVVAGRCGRVDSAFELLSEMAAEGIRPSGSSVSALIHACMGRGNLALARRVYDLCSRQGVYPVVSQFNRMMDVYASEGRFGEVVSLLGDMVAAGRQPNLNTYRVLINAATFTDQAGLAFQIFALMHANRIQILQLKYAQTIYYMLIKSCFNQTRFMWVPGGYPPTAPTVMAPTAHDAAAASTTHSTSPLSHGAAGPHSQPSHSQHSQPHSSQPSHHHTASLGPALRAERRAQADKVLEALGWGRLRRSAHTSNPFDGPPETIDWTSHALSAFHHMLSRGFKPTLELLDLLLGCMRAKMMSTESGADAAAGPASVMSPFVSLRSRDEVFEVAFENRAFVVMEEAISRGLLPPYDPETPLVLNMRRMPPVVAEVYVLHILRTLERRAERRKAAEAAGAGAASGGGGGSYHHSITLLVPPFDPDLVKWPSYLERLMNHYTAAMSPEERAKLRYRNPHRRSRSRRYAAAAAAAAAAAGTNGAGAGPAADGDSFDEDADGAGYEFGHSRGGGAAVSSYDELEAAISGSDDDDEVPGAADSQRDPWAYEDLYGWEAEGTDFAGGYYLADSTTGLAVAATLQRMKVWMDMDYGNGAVTVFAVEVARWLKRRRQAAEEAAQQPAAAAAKKAAAAPTGADGPLAARDAGGNAGTSVRVSAPGVMGGAAAAAVGMVGARGLMGRGGPMGRGNPVEQQQRDIRLGMMGAAGPSGRAAGTAGGAFGPPAAAALTGSGHQPQSAPARATAASSSGENGVGNPRGRQAAAGPSANPRGGQRPASAPPEAASREGAATTGATAAEGGSQSGAAAALKSLAARLPSGAAQADGPRDEPRMLKPRRPAAQPAVNGNGQHPEQRVNGSNGNNGYSATAAAGAAAAAGQQQQPRRGPMGALPDAYVLSVPPQHAQVEMGPGVQVSLPLAAPPEAPAAEAAAAASSG